MRKTKYTFHMGSGGQRSALISGLTALALLAGAREVAAQESLLERVQSALSAADAQRVERIAEAAERDGVPAELVYEKALEGAAKGVPVERIVVVLETYAAGLHEAGRALGPGHDPQTVAVAADALRRGATGPAVAELAGSHPDDLSIALLVLGELTEADVPVEDAVEVVSEALARGADPDELLEISAEVRRRVRAGELPAAAAAAVGRARGRPAGVPPAGAGTQGQGVSGGAPAGPPVPPGAGPPGRGPPETPPGRN